MMAQMDKLGPYRGVHGSEGQGRLSQTGPTITGSQTRLQALNLTSTKPCTKNRGVGIGDLGFACLS